MPNYIRTERVSHNRPHICRYSWELNRYFPMDNVSEKRVLIRTFRMIARK